MSFLNDLADESFTVDDPSLGIDSLLNDTRDSYFETPQKTSTPQKSAAHKKSSKNLFKEPKIQRQYFTCDRCKKKFRTANLLKKHLRSHVLKDAASQIISTDNVKSVFEESVDRVLTEIIKEDDGNFSTSAALFKEYSNCASLQRFKDVVCGVLCDGIVGKAFVMPSAMWGSLLSCINAAMNNAENMNALKKHLLDFGKDSTSSEVCWPFVVDFFHKVAAAVTATLTHRMAEVAGVQAPEERAVRSSDDFSTERDQATAFHIFGFVIKQFCRKALSAKKSVYWTKILNVIESQFVKGGLVMSCAEGIEAWTASISRGSLTFVGDHAFKFFIELARVIQGMEERNGSLSHDSVLIEVYNTPALLTLWDTVIGSTLDQDDACTFLSSVVKSVTNVAGVGIRDRRLNQEVSHGSVNVGLRSSLAPRQSADSSKH